MSSRIYNSATHTDKTPEDRATQKGYESENIHWVDVSTPGSDYEVQKARHDSNTMRHRHRPTQGPWREGHPPEHGDVIV